MMDTRTTMLAAVDALINPLLLTGAAGPGSNGCMPVNRAWYTLTCMRVVCVHACVRACVRAYVHACECVHGV